jgi:hypothetical protein
MSNQRQLNNALRRNVAWTHCEGGPLDLRPTTTTHSSGYLDASIDFEAESCRLAPKFGETLACWSPGYLKHEKGKVIGICADLIALTSQGMSASQVYRWLITQGLTGLVWPTATSTRARPTSCAVLLLDSIVDQHWYKRIWLRLSAEVFGNTSDPAQADFRHRFEYPCTSNHKSRLLRHDAHALPASYGLILDAIGIEPIAAAPKRVSNASMK